MMYSSNPSTGTAVWAAPSSRASGPGRRRGAQTVSHSRSPPPTRGAASSTKTWDSGRSRCTRCSSSRAVSTQLSAVGSWLLWRVDWDGAGADSHTRLRFVAKGGVEELGFFFFDLCFNVRDAALRAEFVYGR